jgi:hypothetical protein
MERRDMKMKKALSLVISLALILVSAAIITASAAGENLCEEHNWSFDSARHWCEFEGCALNEVINAAGARGERHSGVNDCICGFDHPCSDANGGHIFRNVNDDVHNCARDCTYLNSENHDGHDCLEVGEHWQHMNCRKCDFQHSLGPGCGTCDECVIPCGICGCLICGVCGDCEKCLAAPETPSVDVPVTDDNSTETPEAPEVPEAPDTGTEPAVTENPAVAVGNPGGSDVGGSSGGGGSGGVNIFIIILVGLTTVIFAAATVGAVALKNANV